MARCSGIFGFLFGHKFAPRYHRESKATPNAGQHIQACVETVCRQAVFLDSSAQSVLQATLDSAEDLLTDSKTRYVYDVCTRCGATIDSISERPVITKTLDRSKLYETEAGSDRQAPSNTPA